LVLGMVFGDGQSNRVNQIYPRPSLCYGNEIRDKICYNSAFGRYICTIFAPIGGLGVGPSNAAKEISPDPPWLPWQRNLRQNGL